MKKDFSMQNIWQCRVYMAYPPDTFNTSPVIKPERSDPKKYIASAASSGEPVRRSGVFKANSSRDDGSTHSVIFVSIKPGATAFTLIFEGPSSFASALVRPMTPALEAEYAASHEPPDKPQTDETLTIAPEPFLIIAFAAARQV